MKKEYKSKNEPYPSDYTHKESESEYWAEKYLGSMGRMVGGSKSIYSYDNPKNLVIYNANVLTKEDGKIWYGDLDVTEDYVDLAKLSKKIKKTVYVLYESDARFGKEDKVDFSKAPVSFDGSKMSFRDPEYLYEKDGVPYRKTDEELDVENKADPDYKEPVFNYDKKDYHGSVKLPDLSKYKLTVKQSPLDFYQKTLIEMFGMEKANKIHLRIYVKKEYSEQLKTLLEKFCKRKFKFMHPVKIQQAIDWTLFDAGPTSFLSDPPWAKDPKMGYLRKEKS